MASTHIRLPNGEIKTINKLKKEQLYKFENIYSEEIVPTNTVRHGNKSKPIAKANNRAEDVNKSKEYNKRREEYQTDLQGEIAEFDENDGVNDSSDTIRKLEDAIGSIINVLEVIREELGHITAGENMKNKI